MTPQEQADYKRQWMMTNPYEVNFHSDLHRKAIAWCKENVAPESYVLHKWSSVYIHTMYFENSADAINFKKSIVF